MRLASSICVALFFVSGCYQAHGPTSVACIAPSDCPPPLVACADATCLAGFCQLVARPDRCPFGTTCDVDRGCVGPGADVPLRDAGPPPDGFVIRDTPFPFDGPFPIDAPLRFDTPFVRPDVPFPDVPFPDVPFPDVPFRDVPFRDVPFPDVPFPFDTPFVRPDVPRPDVPFPDVPFPDVPFPDVPFVRPDVPLRDAPLIDVPPATSGARRCRPDSVMTMLDHPLFATEESTLELWVRVRGPGIVAQKGDGARHYFRIVVEGTGPATQMYASWGTEDVEVRAPFPFARWLDQWAHVAVVYTDTSVEVYVNAVLMTSQTAVGLRDAFNTQAFLFCSFDGDVDDIRFWGGALPPDLIEARRFGPVPGDTPGLFAYWPLEGRGQVIFDRTLHGADGVAGDVSTPDARDPEAITDGAF